MKTSKRQTQKSSKRMVLLVAMATLAAISCETNDDMPSTGSIPSGAKWQLERFTDHIGNTFVPVYGDDTALFWIRFDADGMLAGSAVNRLTGTWAVRGDTLSVAATNATEIYDQLGYEDMLLESLNGSHAYQVDDSLLEIDYMTLLWGPMTATFRRMDGSTVCGCDRPLEQLEWLREAVDEMRQSGLKANVYVCKYDSDKDGFLLEMCEDCPDMGASFTDCAGNAKGVLWGLAGLGCEAFGIDPESIVKIWSTTNN